MSMTMSMPPARRRLSLICSALTLSLLGACALQPSTTASSPAPSASASTAATDSASPQPSDTAAANGPVTGELKVLAAASLTDVFQQLATTFQQANPGVHVTFEFGGSSTLAQQIVAKIPADVFAAASDATMKTVADAGDAVGTPALFVRNVLEIAVPPNNPGNVTSLADLGKSSLKVVVCAVAVPCGAAAQKVFTAANLTPTIASYEQDVRGVLTKVEAGEADAGLVYQTDVKSAGDKVKGIDFAEASTAINNYPIAALAGAPNASAAAAWVAFITGPQARQAFLDAGFQVP
jgi:molybdate transport system substrate-binding protein